MPYLTFFSNIYFPTWSINRTHGRFETLKQQQLQEKVHFREKFYNYLKKKFNLRTTLVYKQ